MRRLTLALTMALPLATIPAGEIQAQQVPVSSRPIPTPPEEPPPLDPMSAARSPRHLLRNGQDYLRYREFDRALVLFREAESRQSELTAAESKQLNQAIEAALKGLHEPAPTRGPIPGVEPQPGTIALAEPNPSQDWPPVPSAPPISPDGIQLTSATVSNSDSESNLAPAPPLPELEPEPTPQPSPSSSPIPIPLEPISPEPVAPALPQLPLGSEAPETPELLFDSTPTPPVSPAPLEEPAEIGLSMPPTFSSSPTTLTSPEPLPPLPPPADELLLPELPEVLENETTPEPAQIQPEAAMAPEPAPEPTSLPVTTALDRDQEYVDTLSPELRRRVEQIARRQEEEEQLRGLPPYDMTRTFGDDDPTFTSLELPRAPSPTEPIPIESIPVPEEFEPIEPREWSPRRKYWAAAATCHGPLYFQDAVLERYGQGVEQSVGPIGRFLSYPLDDPTQTQQRNQIAQPFISAGLFASQIILWPYNLIMDPPGEAEYDLGYHRPGDRIPPGTIYLPPYGVGPALRGKHY